MATVVFFPEGAYGPTNNCVGIGQVLRARGHRVVFVVEESFAGTLEARGFEEAHVRLAPPPEQPEAPGQFWKDFIRDTAPEFRKPTIEQLETFLLPTWQALIDGARYVDEQLAAMIDDLAPDAIVEDNVVAFAALATCGRPWARIVSCNPLEVKDPGLPPVFSGYPAGDRSGWAAFWERYDAVLGPQIAAFDEWLRGRGAPGLPPRDYVWESPYLNLFLYPAEADYRRDRPLGPTWHRLGSCVRAGEEPFDVDALLPGRAPVVYLSLGSLGSADVALMRRLVAALAETPYRVIVSKGPQHEEIELPDRMLGAELLPQPSVLPQVDVVVTHGGNNTVTEALHFGKPTVVLPLFWDQYDNAQRMDELGLGIRLDAYRCEPAELTGAVDRLLADAALGERLARISANLQASPGTHLAADLVERLAAGGRPVTRRAGSQSLA